MNIIKPSGAPANATVLGQRFADLAILPEMLMMVRKFVQLRSKTRCCFGAPPGPHGIV
jgi:hypothetical protein